MLHALKLLLVCLLTLPLVVVVILLGPFDRKGKVADKICRFWTWAILEIGRIRLNVEGLEHLDSGRQYIFMANHQSNIDIPVLVQSLPGFQLRWIAKRELLFVPLFGWALWAARHIIVDRTDRVRAMVSLRKAKEKIQGGISVVVFPEGTRSPSGELLPFKRGGFVLAAMTKTPIVPITINGSRAILPKGHWRIRGGEIEVIVSRPVYLDDYRRENLESLIHQVRQAMESHLRPESDTTRKGAKAPFPVEAEAQR